MLPMRACCLSALTSSWVCLICNAASSAWHFLLFSVQPLVQCLMFCSLQLCQVFEIGQVFELAQVFEIAQCP